MNRETFNRQFLGLVKAFLYAEGKADPETQDVYWEMLKGIPEEKFLAGVRHCLATCKFFPTIAELGEALMPTVIKEISRCPAYNPWGRHEDYLAKPVKVKVDWQQQLKEKATKDLPLPDDIKKLTDGIGS